MKMTVISEGLLVDDVIVDLWGAPALIVTVGDHEIGRHTFTEFRFRRLDEKGDVIEDSGCTTAWTKDHRWVIEREEQE